MFWWEPIPVAPPVMAQNNFYILEPTASAQNTVYITSPTHMQGRVGVVAANQVARDQANIMIQKITQDYFQTNIKNFLPREYWRMDGKLLTEGGGEGALDHVTQVFAITLDEIKQAIDEFPLLFDIDHCPSRYLRVIAELLIFPLEDSDNTAEQRRQLKEAVAWYRSKGSRKAYEAILYAFGFYAQIIPLWSQYTDEVTEDASGELTVPANEYEIFYETVPGVGKGNDPPNDYPLLLENGGTWFRSPHFGIRLLGIVNDRHVTLDLTGAPGDLETRFNTLADEIGYHKAYYQMIDEISAAGIPLQYHLDNNEFHYMLRRVEFLRPVFAVLDWMEMLVEMQEEFPVPEAPDPVITVNPTRDEKGWYLGYCDMDDLQYTRLDSRLLGPDMLSLVSPLGAGLPGVTDVVGEIAETVVGTPTHVSGTLANSWLFSGVDFTVTIGAAPVTVLDTQDIYPRYPLVIPVSGEVISVDPDGIETSFMGLFDYRPIIESWSTVYVDVGSGIQAVALTHDDEGNITGELNGEPVTGTVIEADAVWTLNFATAPIGGSTLTADYEYYQWFTGEIISDDADGATLAFAGTVSQRPMTVGGVEYLIFDLGTGMDTIPINDDGAGNLSGMDPLGGLITGTVNYSTGAWTLLFTNAPVTDTFVIMIYLYPSAEGTLHAEGVTGVINYVNGVWFMDFEPGYEPDTGTDILIDYSFSTEIPPTDRSGIMPRGSTELPFPHLRDPQEGYCHPPEELDVEWFYIEEEPYTLALTRDGLNLYPPAGPVPFIDHADFPSRGFTNAALDPKHANTFTRELGYSLRPLSLLKVEANPAPDAENWENQGEGWEAWIGPWENIGD